jgi:hypothetical protein
MVELLVFAPGEEIDEKEFAELSFPALARAWISGGPWIAGPRFAVRRAAFEARTPPPANPLSVRCPDCGAEQWDPCVSRTSFDPFATPKVSLHTHAERRGAAGKATP